jgi:hypothetical protein
MHIGHWWEGSWMGWCGLAQHKDRWTALNLQVTSNAGKFLSSLATGGFSGRTQLHENWLVTGRGPPIVGCS